MYFILIYIFTPRKGCEVPVPGVRSGVGEIPGRTSVGPLGHSARGHLSADSADGFVTPTCLGTGSGPPGSAPLGPRGAVGWGKMGVHPI